MRRKDREVTDFNKVISFIDECDIIRLGITDGDYPYIVPVNFAYEVNGNDIDFYIHGAMAGRKYELLSQNGKCSFEMDVPVKMECVNRDVTMRYKSVMGKALVELVSDSEKEEIMDNIIMKRYDLTRDFPYNKKALAVTAIARLKVIEITAKENPLNGSED